MQKGRFQTQAIFGSKFAAEFPRKKASCSNGCGCGIYDKQNGSRGIDLVLDSQNLDVVNPVSGHAFKVDNSTVAIIPDSENMQMYIIIVRNVRFINENLQKNVGTVLQSGDFLAKGVLHEACPPHINVAVREQNMFDDTGEEFNFIDPSVFLLKRFPTSQWKQHCNDYSFEQKGQVADEGDASAHPRSKQSVVHRRGSDEGIKKDVNNINWGNLTTLQAQPLIHKTDISKKLLQNLLEIILKQEDIHNTSNTLNRSITEVLESLPRDQSRAALDILKSLVNKTLEKNMIGFKEKVFRVLTREQQISLMEQSLLQISKKCPSLKHSIPQGINILCKAHFDCNGMTCTLALKNDVEMIEIDFTYRFDPTNSQFFIYVNNRLELNITSDTKEINVHLDEEKYAVMTVSIIKHVNFTKVNFFGQLCNYMTFDCFEKNQILGNIQYKNINPNTTKTIKRKRRSSN
ncbi:uncharacterized protein LOC134259688, partial [Saccostrea cucullata]